MRVRLRRLTATTLAVALTFVVALFVVALPGVAVAHGVGAILTIHSDGRGAVWVTAGWQDDGHPIIDSLAGTLTATSRSGQRLGPAALRPLRDGAGTLAFNGSLTPGDWSVVADLAAPAVGHCEAEVRVVQAGASVPPPTAVRCGDIASPVAAPTSSGSGISLGLVAAGIGLLVAAGVAVLVLQRSRPRALVRSRSTAARPGRKR